MLDIVNMYKDRIIRRKDDLIALGRRFEMTHMQERGVLSESGNAYWPRMTVSIVA